MQTLSHTIARRLAGAFAASLGLLLLATSPAHAGGLTAASAATIAASKAKAGQDMVSASNVQSVIDYLKSKGDTVTQSTDDDGAPLLTEAGNYYNVYFMCDEDNANCNTIQFRACYSAYPDAGLEQTNALTRDFVFAKSYISTQGFACIEQPVATGLKGISYEVMDLSYDAFTTFTGNAAEEFAKK